MKFSPSLSPYRWEAVYGDGSVYTQPEGDVSERHPGRSAFADVDLDRLAVFRAINLEFGSIWEVDLQKYEIRCNGTRTMTVPDGATLVFFRRHLVDLSRQTDRVAYHLGWTHAGKQFTFPLP